MKHVGPTRAELGTRTIFNLLGPLANPAGVKRLLVGVFAPEWVSRSPRCSATSAPSAPGSSMAPAASTRFRSSAPTTVAALENGKVTTFEVSPTDVGMAFATIDAIKGGDATHNAEALRGILRGTSGPYRDMVLLNAAAALVVAGKAADLAEGVRARRAVHRRRAAALDTARSGWSTVSNRAGPRWLTSCKTIEASKRAEIAAAKAAVPPREIEAAPGRGPPPRGFLTAIEATIAEGAPGADRRDQEGEPVEGADPRRLRSADARPRLCRRAAPPASRCSPTRRSSRARRSTSPPPAPP